MLAHKSQPHHPPGWVCTSRAPFETVTWEGASKPVSLKFPFARRVRFRAGTPHMGRYTRTEILHWNLEFNQPHSQGLSLPVPQSERGERPLGAERERLGTRLEFDKA